MDVENMLIAEDVKGFEKLKVQANKEMFKQFLINFYQAWGLDARETIVPISIKFCKDKSNSNYLRFDYKMYDKAEWIHVRNSRDWY